MNSCVPKELSSTTPPQCVLTLRGAFGAVADAVAPVVLVGEAAAGPAQHRHAELLERGDDVVAEAARVGDRRVLADPDAFVDQAAEVLGELAVDGRVDDGAGRVGAHGDFHRCRFGARTQVPLARQGNAGKNGRELRVAWRCLAWRCEGSKLPASAARCFARPAVSCGSAAAVLRPPCGRGRMRRIRCDASCRGLRRRMRVARLSGPSAS